MEINERLGELFYQSGLNMTEFSKRSKISRQAMYSIINGRDTRNLPLVPTLPTLKNICIALNYDFALFLAETGYINPERVCMNDAEADLLKAFRGNYDNNFIELNKNKSENVEKGLEIGK